jgi:hypothetical protein
VEDGDDDGELRVRGPRRRVAERRALPGGGLRQPRLPVARDAERVEAGLGELAQDGAALARGVVDRADEERLLGRRGRSGAGIRLGLVVPAAAGEHDEQGERRETPKHRG